MLNRNVKLSPKQVVWLSCLMRPAELLHLFLSSAAGRKFEGDSNFQKRFYHFLKGSKSIDRNVASSIWKCLGLSDALLKVVDQVVAADVGQVSDFKPDMFLKNCSSLLWTGRIEGERVDMTTVAPAILGLVERIVLHRRRLSTNEKRWVLGGITDYLTETRGHQQWDRLAVGIALKPDAPDKLQMDRDVALFPSVDDFLSHRYDDIDEHAFKVRCKGLHINSLRHRLYRLREEKAELELRAQAKPGVFEVALKGLEDEIAEVHNERGIRGEFAAVKTDVGLFLRDFAALEKFPVDRARRYFVFCCLRLLVDWGKYHYQSDRSEAVRALRLVVNICDQYVSLRKDLVSRGKWDWGECDDMFPYLASIACLAQCGAVESAKSYDRVCRMLEFAHEAWLMSFSDAGRFSAVDYRMSRNYARCLTTAARWWLKSGAKRMPIDCGQKSNGFQLIGKAAELWRKNIISGIRWADGEVGHRVILRAKRGLEHEFHLRVQIELMAFDVRRGLQRGGATWLRRARYAYCMSILIYCHLFPSEVVGKLHVRVEKWLGEHPDDAAYHLEYFRREDLGISRQASMPSIASQLESARMILLADRGRVRFIGSDSVFAKSVVNFAAAVFQRHCEKIAEELRKLSPDELRSWWRQLRYEPAASLDEVISTFTCSTGLDVPEEV